MAALLVNLLLPGVSVSLASLNLEGLCVDCAAMHCNLTESGLLRANPGHLSLLLLICLCTTPLHKSQFQGGLKAGQHLELGMIVFHT